MNTLSPKTTGHRRHRILRIATAFILGLSGAVVAVVAVAAPATAACSGSLGFRGATSTGELVVYYSTSSGGTNCAQMNHRGSTYGVTSSTSVGIVKCTQTTPDPPCTYSGSMVIDSGNYAYYAGPVRVTSTNGRCVFARGYLKGVDYSTVKPVMCG